MSQFLKGTKAADVWSKVADVKVADVKVADVKVADVESNRQMLGLRWPIFELKQPMFLRPLFWHKVADVVLERPIMYPPMSLTSKAADSGRHMGGPSRKAYESEFHHFMAFIVIKIHTR